MHNGEPSVFGSIKFAGVKRAPSKWCAVSSNSEPLGVYQMVLEAWKLSPPPVLIAVTGAAGSLNLSKRDEKIFRRGLRNAALQTNAWIVTGGSAAGVMQLVGSLVHESGRQGTTKQIVCLGIAPWGVVQDHEEMLASGRGQVFSAKDFAQGEQKIISAKEFAQGEQKIEFAQGEQKIKRTRLDPNHSHFIFVDDGSEGEFGREIEFRPLIASNCL
jgi:transient receptor potential cation channel subfamily M protein 2